MSSGFVRLGLDPALCTAVQAAFNIETPSTIQEKVIQSVLELNEDRRDILIRSRTGSGKTLAFILPILNRLILERRTMEGVDTRALGTLVLLIVPTRELAAQTQQAVASIIAKLRGRDHWPVCATLSGGDRRKSEKAALRKGVHIVVGTPGRLLDHLQNTQKWSEQIGQTCRWVVLDEADRLFDSGFEKSVKEIMLKVTGGRVKNDLPQIFLCSATVDGGRKDIFGYELNLPLFISEKGGKVNAAKDENPSGLISDEAANMQLEHFYICPPTKFRLAALLGYLEELFSKDTAQKVVLFSICCDTVDFIAALLSDPTFKLLKNDVKLSKLHGNLVHKTRLETFAAFTKETTNCLLVCTDVAARGLNLSHVTCIVQFDAPCDMNDYLHRAGRTARQHETGQSVLFLMPSERDYVGELLKKNSALKAIKWDPLVERISQRVDKTLLNKIKYEDDLDEEVKSVNVDLRKKILVWLGDLQDRIKTKAELFQQAQRAFLSFVRAYATHPAAEKAIFHIKKLHLGHLAATFLLAEAPKTVAAHRAKVSTTNFNEKNKTTKFGEHKGKVFSGRQEKRSFKIAPKKRALSEFDAGDIVHSKPRNKK